MKFEKGQIYQNEETNIYIKGVSGDKVRFIEDASPCALHWMEEIEADDLIEYMDRYEFKRACKEFEEFVNA